MGRDKAKDDAYINCEDVHELAYVAGLYGDKKDEVMSFLLGKCEIGTVNYVTHKEVYERIEKNLGLKIPD
jgi:hypothetical protein